MEKDNIKDKVIIITGASSGIGEAAAKLLANKGAKVVLGARRIENLKKLTEDIKSEGGAAIYAKLDVTKPADNNKIVQLALKTYGTVNAIVLNAGIMPLAPLSALKTEEWNETVDVNIKGVLHGVAAVLPIFTKQKSGHIITVSSVAGLKPYPGGAVYGGTKWFVRDFMEVLRMESALEKTNIRTAAIYPAAIDTELLNAITHKESAEILANVYKQYSISPSRVANVIAFAINQPDDTNVNEFTLGPTTQPW